MIMFLSFAIMLTILTIETAKAIDGLFYIIPMVGAIICFGIAMIKEEKMKDAIIFLENQILYLENKNKGE